MASRDQSLKEAEWKRACWWCVWVAVLVSQCSAGSKDPLVPSFIAFGDSTVDVGTNTVLATLVKADFLPYGRDFQGGKPTGRFTNGLMVIDILAMKLGLPLMLPFLDPDAEGERILAGVNFASAASGFLDDTSSFLKILPASEQMQMFRKYQAKVENMVGREKAHSILSEAIYGISAGSNDYLLNYLINPFRQEQTTTSEFSSWILSNQTAFMTQLYDAGARKILIFGFPPLGCLPVEITTSGGLDQRDCVEDLNKIAVAYNNRLLAAIDQLQATLPGLRILYTDVYTYIVEAFSNPSKYGYTETRRGCCGEGLFATTLFCNAKSIGTCADPSTFMFFDSVHPTEKVYKAIADLTFNSMVPFFGLSTK